MKESFLVAADKIDADLIISKNIEKLEGALMKLPQADCPVTHTFGPGVCLREVKLPAGSIVIGHHQNFEHVNIFVKGRVSMRNDDGTFTEMKAPMTFVGKPGRKIGYIHEDVVWLNVWKTDEKDVEKIETHFLTKSQTWKESAAISEKCLQLKSGLDREDFKQMAKEIGWSIDDIKRTAEDESDMIELPSGSYKMKVGQSKIDGRGLIATGEIAAGEIIAPARIGKKRTIAGRFTNHSISPNAAMEYDLNNDQINLIAIRSIHGCRGGLGGEEITIDYRKAYQLTIAIAEIKEGEKCLR